MKKTGIAFAASVMAMGLVLAGCSAAVEETVLETVTEAETSEVTTASTTKETTQAETKESEAGTGDEKIVKTKTTYEIDSSMDDYVVTGIHEFNEKGLIVSSSTRSRTLSDDFRVTTYTYEYDDKGRPVKRVETEPDQSEKSLEYEYDNDGNEISVTSYENGTFNSKTVKEYDEYGNWIKSTSYDEDNNVKNTVLREYNERGNVLKSTTFLSDGSKFATTVFEYDEENRMTKETGYNSNDKEFTRSEFEFDDNGYTVKQKNYSADTLTYVNEFERDADGTLLAIVVTIDHGDSYEIVRTVYEYY